MKDTIIIDAKKSVIRCQLCKEEKALPLPLEIEKFFKWTKGFRLMHENCEDKNGR